MPRTRSLLTNIAAEELRSVIDYDEDTGIFLWKWRADRDAQWNGHFAGKVAGSPDADGRSHIRINKVRYLASRLAWLYVYGIWPGDDLDHEDTDPSNDRIINLREATLPFNLHNARISASNTSGYKGVSWFTNQQKWRAAITIDSRKIHLGFFDDVKLAAQAYDEAAKRYFGEFGRSNEESV